MQSSRKCVPHGSSKDLWLVVREGAVADVDNLLALLKKNGGNVNARDRFGLTPLHIATWRNHVPIVRRLLDAGADPNARVCLLFDLLHKIIILILGYLEIVYLMMLAIHMLGKLIKHQL